MRRDSKAEAVQGEGLDSLVGKQVLLFCLNYIYLGKLIEVSESFVRLEKPSIVYDTGPFSTPEYTDVQPLHTCTWYVQRTAIESFGLGK